MELKDELMELADLFYKNEAALSEYYELCAGIFPDHLEKWLLLKKQEDGHASIFLKIKNSISESPNRWEKGKFHPMIIKTMLDEITKKINEIKARKISEKVMLNFILDFEGSLIESELGKAFKTDISEFNSLLSLVDAQTINHRKMLIEITGGKKL